MTIKKRADCSALFQYDPELGLEVEPQTPFNLSRIVNGGSDLPEVCRLIQSQVVGAAIARIAWLKMIEHIRELHRELQANALSEFDFLCQRGVQIPSIETPEVSRTAATGIDAENAAPEAIKDCRRVSKHVEAFEIICPNTV